MNKCRLYSDLANLWTLVSPVEEYAQEADDWTEALHEKLEPARNEILELGSGGGHLLFHLRKLFCMTAVDVALPMLQNSMTLNPAVSHHLGDMRSVRLGKKFDAVIIHDAIDYLLNEADIEATLATVREHLREGGIFITVPQCSEDYCNPHIHQGTHSAGDKEVTCISCDYDPDPSDTTVESLMIYLVKERGNVRMEVDHHTTGSFPKSAWFEHLTKAGFRAEWWPCRHSGERLHQNLLVGTLCS